MRMMSRSGFQIAIAAGAIVAACAVTPSSATEQAQRPGASSAARKPSPAVTPRPKPPTVSARQESAPQAKPWSIEDALPSQSSALRAPAPASASGASNLGRIPLQQGSVGFETETKVKPNQLPDGRPIPSLTTTREPPSYLGFSLSVPTDSKSILPPLSAPWSRAD